MHASVWRTALLLLWPVAGHAANATFPQTVGFHLLFPRNTTYAPATGVFPVVFSMNDTQLAGPLQPSFQYTLYNETEWASAAAEGRTPSSLDTWSSEGLLTTANFTSRDPFFWAAGESQLGQEGQWRIEYHVRAAICHANPASAATNGSLPLSLVFHDDVGHVVFTTRNGTAAVDLVAGTASRSCRDVPYARTFNVTGLLDVADPSTFRDQPTCPQVDFDAILANPPEPTSNATNCGIALDAAAAASLMAAVTSTACAVAHPDPAYCPNANTSSSTSAAGRSVSTCATFSVFSLSVSSLSTVAWGVLAMAVLL